MTAKQVLEHTIRFCDNVLRAYLSDLDDGELLVRPVPGANHIAWQLGHLIASERSLVSELGHAMPELPPGFAEAHSRETAGLDDPQRFASKRQYLELLDRVRAGTLAALHKTAEPDFDRPAPERFRAYAPTVMSVFHLVGTHMLMHAGQFVPVRRKLGKPVLF